MLKRILLSLLLGLSLLGSGIVQADVFKLQFKDAIFGGHRTLDLKKALKNQHRVDANTLEIEKVEVIVKSQQGGGQVWLGSRYSQTNRKTAAGSMINYNNPAAWTFARLSFPVNGMGNDLTLNLNGQLKLREVIVHARMITDSESMVKNKQGDARITIPMNNKMLMGVNSINLKELLRSGKKRVNPDRYNLKGIEVAAKSRQGGGQAWLESGHQASKIQTLAGMLQTFADNSPGTYDRKYFKSAQSNNQTTPWLLKFNGNVKVNEIIINLAPR